MCNTYRMVLLLYRLIFPVLATLAAPWYWRRLRRREKGRADQAKPAGYHLGLDHRFGRYEPELLKRLQAKAPWWLCSISVGETLLALKLARALKAQDSDAVVVLSVTTSTGFELLLRETANLPWVIPIYNPVDLRFAATRALEAIRPRALILIEGGIWPNLLSLARRRKIPVTLASARLSPRSEKRWRALQWATRPLWNLIGCVAVATEADRLRFSRIGVPPGRLHVTGNIKFDLASTPAKSRVEEFRALLAPLGFGELILVAGSTWAPEEQAIADALEKLRPQFPNLRCIIVPRHVERAAEARQAFKNLRVIRRSEMPSDRPADVLLVDTTGELRDWYACGTVAFVGKSLPGISEVGGQNPGEPAALGVPVVFGPHMENFAALAKHLVEESAAIQVVDGAALIPAFAQLLGDAETRATMAQRGRIALSDHQGAATRTAALLLGDTTSSPAREALPA